MGVAVTQRCVRVSFLQARFPSSENGQFHFNYIHTAFNPNNVLVDEAQREV